MEKIMKKAFISIYVLLILLVFALTITFIYKENDTNADIVQALYNKKVATYEAESAINIIFAEKKSGRNIINKELLDNFDHKAQIEITRGISNNESLGVDNLNIIKVEAKYKGTYSITTLAYKEDKNKNLIIVYERVY